jgi:hypothetical protein
MNMAYPTPHVKLWRGSRRYTSVPIPRGSLEDARGLCGNETSLDIARLVSSEDRAADLIGAAFLKDFGDLAGAHGWILALLNGKVRPADAIAQGDRAIGVLWL